MKSIVGAATAVGQGTSLVDALDLIRRSNISSIDGSAAGKAAAAAPPAAAGGGGGGRRKKQPAPGKQPTATTRRKRTPRAQKAQT